MQWRNVARRVVRDVRRRTHLEAYALTALGIVLAVLGVIGVASNRLLLSSMLLATTFLIFNITDNTDPSTRTPSVAGRDNLGTFTSALPDGGTLLVYGPTAVNILVNASDIKTKVIDKGGVVRVIVQDPLSPATRFVEQQLDDSLDFNSTLNSSINNLRRMTSWGNCEFRLLPFSPGFSMIMINPESERGLAIIELHGFDNETISDRMHIRIVRRDSVRWFDYWARCFETMWDQAHTDDKALDDEHQS